MKAAVAHRLWVAWDNIRNRIYWLLADHVRIIRMIHDTGVRVDELAEDVHELGQGSPVIRAQLTEIETLLRRTLAVLRDEPPEPRLRLVKPEDDASL